jgi:hypothetical protein
MRAITRSRTSSIACTTGCPSRRSVPPSRSSRGQIIARSDPERAQLVALRLLTDNADGRDYQTDALRAIALAQATTSLIAAERTAVHIQEPVEQAATLIHLASGQRSSVPRVDTEVPKIPLRLNYQRLKYLRESSP